jgi:nucleotide-binding universal stress UspA family protein
MNVKTALARLHSTLDLDDRMDQLLLLPRLTQPTNPTTDLPSASVAVGYDGSARSQVALDLAFCVAHQMQLATRQQAMIHVVYVIDCMSVAKASHKRRVKRGSDAARLGGKSKSSQATTADRGSASLPQCQTGDRSLEEIDRVLWQARCLAEEWRGSFTTHLRFGDLATELESFVAEEKAALLFLGCYSASHPLVQKLKFTLPCPVVGIPTSTSRSHLA